MNHPYYLNAKDFQPSQETLYSWLKTRKSNTSSKPGFFETVDITRDSSWALIALLIELSAFFLTLYGAWSTYLKNHNVVMLTTALILVILFVAFDIIGILLHSYDKPEKVLLKNELHIIKDPTVRLFKTKELKSISWRTFLGMLLLIFSGMLKIVAVLVYFRSQSAPAGFVVLVIFYLVVIYIHFYHTSYWWSAFTTHKKIKKEYNQWYQAWTAGLPLSFSAVRTLTIFYSPYKMGSDRFQNGRQEIIYLGKEKFNGIEQNKYELISYGLLWDEEITSMLMNFSPGLHDDVLKACIRLQLNQINRPFIDPASIPAQHIDTQ
jgi:hypothetical protein